MRRGIFDCVPSLFSADADLQKGRYSWCGGKICLLSWVQHLPSSKNKKLYRSRCPQEPVKINSTKLDFSQLGGIDAIGVEVHILGVKEGN